MIPITATQLRTVLVPLSETDVRERARLHDYTSHDLVASALTLARVLLFSGASQDAPWAPESPESPYEGWVRTTFASSAYLARILAGWMTIARDDLGLYPIFLYNRDFGRARAVMDGLLRLEPAPPPYLDLLLQNALRQAQGISHDELAALADRPFTLTASHLERLFSDDRLDAWLRGKRQPLRFYGGATNTVLGLYDAIFADTTTGIDVFTRDAAGRFDLGGGFNTSEIERLLGRTFVSADMITPRYEDYDPELVLRVAGRRTTRVATRHERDVHRTLQGAIEHLPLDVLRDGLPRQHESYAIVSTGFMTSTVRPGEHQPDWTGHENVGLGHLGLSVHAMIRVIELVQLGKSVDLFTIQRASSRTYKYKTALVQWRNGRLTRLVTTDDPRSRSGWSPEARTELRRKVDPNGTYFSPPGAQGSGVKRSPATSIR